MTTFHSDGEQRALRSTDKLPVCH